MAIESKEWSVEFFGAQLHKLNSKSTTPAEVDGLTEAVQDSLAAYLEGRDPEVTKMDDGTYHLSDAMEEDMIRATSYLLKEAGLGLTENERNKLNVILIDSKDRQLVY